MMNGYLVIVLLWALVGFFILALLRIYRYYRAHPNLTEPLGETKRFRRALRLLPWVALLLLLLRFVLPFFDSVKVMENAPFVRVNSFVSGLLWGMVA